MCLWQITSGWNVITSVSSGILALGIIAVIWQVHLLKKQNRLTAFNSLLQQWGGEEERKARRYVIREFKFKEGDNLENLDDDSRSKAELVLARCNRISFLASKGLISEKDVFEFAGRSMVRCWDKTKDFIKARRRQVNEPEEGELLSYMYHFQQFIMENRKELEKISSSYHVEGD